MSTLSLMIGIVVIAIITAVVESYFDASKNKPIDHILSAIVRVLGVVLIVYFIPFGIPVKILFVGVVLSVYWIVFDISYNLFKGNDWGYVGNTAWVDKFARKHIGTGFDYLFVKVFVLALFLSGISIILTA